MHDISNTPSGSNTKCPLFAASGATDDKENALQNPEVTVSNESEPLAMAAGSPEVRDTTTDSSASRPRLMRGRADSGDEVHARGPVHVGDRTGLERPSGAGPVLDRDGGRRVQHCAGVHCAART